MMKRLLTTALVGLAGAALYVSRANAQTPITAATGDIILGFYATSGTGAGTDLEVDLGPATKFMTATPGQIFNLSGSAGLALADLQSTYGTNWFSNPNLFWGAISGNTVTPIPGATRNTIWATDPETTPGTPSVPWDAQTIAVQAAGSAAALGVIQGVNTVGVSTANSSASILTTNSFQNSYFGENRFQAGLTFNYFSGTGVTDNAVTNVNASGNSISELDALFTSAAGHHPATVLGKLELNSNGTLQFIAVPEPSTMGLTGVGFLSLVGFVALRRRRSVMA